ncbi:MAG: hypothetical protein J5601_04865 [Elusimicrobiaceae bacterium]|nr:hypothetical protein [Elusimicrobiaceae bacterium]
MIFFLAILFSLIAPGAGHILAGDYQQGIMLGGLFALGKSALLPLALRVWGVKTWERVFRFFYACNVCYMLLIFYAVFSAAWNGWYAQQMHFWHAVIFAFCVTLVHKRTLNKFIFTALCGRSEIYERMMLIAKTTTEKREK